MRLTSSEIIAWLKRHHDCRVVIVRGLPGSGKSTFAAALCRAVGGVQLEADRHFIDREGRYAFDPARTSDAHSVCQRDADQALTRGQRVVIANTHVRLWELAPYIGLAHLHGCAWCVVECSGAWTSVHNVPSEVIATMARKFEAMPEKSAPQVFHFDSSA